MRKFWGAFAFALTLVTSAVCAVDVAYSQEAKPAKNVILFVGDGMGFNSDIVGSYWRCGEPFGLSYQQFPVKLGAATFSVKPDYNSETDKGYVVKQIWRDAGGVNEKGHKETRVTDSGAAGTALNTGEKTVNGYICYSNKGEKIVNFADLNYAAGRAVGVVTTVQISHATPAAASAHNIDRGHYEEISKEQINDSKLSVLFGGGHPAYNNGRKINKKADELNYQFVGGRETWDAVSKDDGYKGWKFIDARADFAALAAQTPDKGGDLPKRVLGIGRSSVLLPSDGNANDEGMKALVDKYSQEAIDATPSLTEMTVGALNVLAQNENGFYLMVEGGMIDGANHSRNVSQTVLEQTGFSKAIDAAIDWVEKYSSWDETLIIVTADHETGQLWGPGSFDDINENGKYDEEDEFVDFMPLEASEIGVVPDVQYLTSGHTNSLVPFYAKGVGAEKALELVRGNDEKAGEIWDFSGDYIYNGDVFNVMLNASGLKK